ncbi:PREDICTED: homeobox protein engrailed-like ceh-16 [Cyprinodon variegatus]|uniref:homeobox protein engrailed-like ceh-16 n=1 Tax=Cyprinodon variegatus TaxID=28743 RepID=UPI00074280F6|nr:PREDICTED: homeobox protein engrailed-like ceh-16 [Cyprinodon variegatus]
MDGSRVSDFSIERILSPHLGRKLLDPTQDGYMRLVPGGFRLESTSSWVPAPVPVPFRVPGCLQYRGMCFGEGFCSCTARFHHAEIRFCTHFGPNPSESFKTSQSGGPIQCRAKARMRTVFTDCQTKQLEALFELTDYPGMELRAELAQNTGLSEETVRVWFKNRRARRKRHHSGPKVKLPSPCKKKNSETEGGSTCCCSVARQQDRFKVWDSSA